MGLKLLSSIIYLFSSAVSFADGPLTFNGDIRYRHDYASKLRDNSQSDSHRERLRLRFGSQANVNESVKARIRFTTSQGASPISGNQTMTDNANKKVMYLDLALVDWQIDDGMNLVLGKQENTFRIVPQSQIIYDADYTPEGVSLTRQGSLFVNLGAYSLVERSPNGTSGTSEPDSWLLAAMVGYKGDLSNSIGFTLALGHHAFTALKDNAVLTSGSFAGNSNYGADTSARYAYDYTVNEALGEVRYKGSDSVANIYVDAIQNAELSSNNHGLITGIGYSTLSERGKPDWTLGYSFTRIDKDATVSAVNHSDFANGEDGSEGHTFVIGKSIAPATSAQLTWMHALIDNNGSAFESDRALMDILFVF